MPLVLRRQRPQDEGVTTTTAPRSGSATRSADAEDIIELIRPELGPLIIQKLCGVREPLRKDEP